MVVDDTVGQHPRIVARRSVTYPLVRAGLALGVAAALLATAATPAWAAASFDPTASSATWDGATAYVTFREAGLSPDQTTTISVTATGNVDGACVRGDAVLFTTHSSGTSTDQSAYPADEAGVVAAGRSLHIEVNPPVVRGLDCTMRVTRAYAVTLHDLDSGAELTLTGTPTPDGIR